MFSDVNTDPYKNKTVADNPIPALKITPISAVTKTKQTSKIYIKIKINHTPPI